MENLAIVITSLVTVLVIAMLTVRKMEKDEAVIYLKEQLYQLFLIAEKQDLIGPEKMVWVVEMIKDRIPSIVLAEILKKQTLEEWAQEKYDELAEAFKGILTK